jgi:hypothetical protein
VASGQGTDPGPAPLLTPANMSFNALFATSAAPLPASPLIGTEAATPLIALQPVSTAAADAIKTAAGPLAAIDAVAGAPAALPDSPLPAPDPLVPPTAKPLALMDPEPSGTEPPPAVPETPAMPQIPQPRIEMTPGVQPNSAFFTQLYWTQGTLP